MVSAADVTSSFTPRIAFCGVGTCNGVVICVTNVAAVIPACITMQREQRSEAPSTERPAEPAEYAEREMGPSLATAHFLKLWGQIAPGFVTVGHDTPFSGFDVKLL